MNKALACLLVAVTAVLGTVGLGKSTLLQEVIERARIALEGGAGSVDALAREVGFGTVETLRRAFRRRVGVSPADYRSRFRPSAAA